MGLKRKCFIVCNPGEKNAVNFCSGVARDLENYTNFLLSPLGGAWHKDEIEIFERPERKTLVAGLNKISEDEYFLFIFSGHGHYCKKQKSTILELSGGEELDSIEVRGRGCAQLIILDCCRIVQETVTLYKSIRMPRVGFEPVNAQKCRAAYDQEIETIINNGGMTIILNSCSVGEASYDDSARGGLFTYNLIDSVHDICHGYQTEKQAYSIQVPEVFDEAGIRVQKISAKKQNPTIVKPRNRDVYLPFGIIA